MLSYDKNDREGYLYFISIQIIMPYDDFQTSKSQYKFIDSLLTFKCRCISEDLLEPKFRPLLCHSSEARKDEFGVACCKNEDVCNAKLNIQLEIKPGEGIGIMIII